MKNLIFKIFVFLMVFSMAMISCKEELLLNGARLSPKEIIIYEDAKPQRVNKPLTGHYKKAGVSVKKHLAEFTADEAETYELGHVLTVSLVETGKKLDIPGISKGKGTQGII